MTDYAKLESELRSAEAQTDLEARAADALAQAVRERDALYRIAIATVNATDGAAEEGVSIEFLSHLPNEVAGVKSQRDAARAELASVREGMVERVVNREKLAHMKALASVHAIFDLAATEGYSGDRDGGYWTPRKLREAIRKLDGTYVSTFPENMRPNKPPSRPRSRHD